MPSDQVGASDSAMQEAVRNFNQRKGEFETAAQNITTDIHALATQWSGDGYDGFQEAMTEWDKDMIAVTADLNSMSNGVQQSNELIRELDLNIATAFRRFVG